MHRVERHQDVLRSGDELACLLVDHREQLEALQVEREVLDVLRESDSSNDKLNKWVYKKSQVRSLSSGECQDPEFHAVVELPAIDVLQGVLRLNNGQHLRHLQGCFGRFSDGGRAV